MCTLCWQNCIFLVPYHDLSYFSDSFTYSSDSRKTYKTETFQFQTRFEDLWKTASYSTATFETQTFYSKDQSNSMQNRSYSLEACSWSQYHFFVSFGQVFVAYPKFWFDTVSNYTLWSCWKKFHLRWWFCAWSFTRSCRQRVGWFTLEKVVNFMLMEGRWDMKPGFRS